jgi:hypothetical protein
MSVFGPSIGEWPRTGQPPVEQWKETPLDDDRRTFRKRRAVFFSPFPAGKGNRPFRTTKKLSRLAPEVREPAT